MPVTMERVARGGDHQVQLPIFMEAVRAAFIEGWTREPDLGFRVFRPEFEPRVRKSRKGCPTKLGWSPARISWTYNGCPIP